MNFEQLRTDWKSEEQNAFQGWDFSRLDGRWEDEKLPWDYKRIILNYMKPSDKLLDMGTGGGEFLLSLHHPHELTSVTEAYPPNVELCKRTLSPLGVDVRQIYDDSEIPFEAEEFDIVINRHEAFNVNEVKRILKSGGCFITQQVGEKNNNDLSGRLINGFIPQFPGHDQNNCVRTLQDAGFDILLSDEAFPAIRFYDVGALVYFAKIIQWEFPGFSVDSCFDSLCKLERELRENGFIAGTEHRFIIAAEKQ